MSKKIEKFIVFLLLLNSQSINSNKKIISNFKYSSSKYNYDSQAYIYSKIFGYDLIFIAIDKTSHQIGIFDCSDSFLEKGQDKVKRAVEAYELFFTTEGFDPKQFFITKTL